MEPRSILSEKDRDFNQDPSQYRRLIGRLIYLNITRLDISFAVQQLSQFMSNPRVPHYNVACHLLRYMKQSLGQGLLFSSKSSLQLKGFCDSDWAKCKNS